MHSLRGWKELSLIFINKTWLALSLSRRQVTTRRATVWWTIRWLFLAKPVFIFISLFSLSFLVILLWSFTILSDLHLLLSTTSLPQDKFTSLHSFLFHNLFYIFEDLFSMPAGFLYVGQNVLLGHCLVIILFSIMSLLILWLWLIILKHFLSQSLFHV
jgi:hypothetical protein